MKRITTNRLMSKFIFLFNFCIMTLCNCSAYLYYESGLFNVNVYIDMKTEFKILVYFINFLTPGKSLYAWVNVCMQVYKFSHQVCFYKSHLLRRK